MLQVSKINTHKEAYIQALKKRNFDAQDPFNKVIALDKERRSIQTNLDNLLAESNKISKEIGNLFKTGQTTEANQLKEKTTAIKEETKVLNENLSKIIAEIDNILYEIPNIPNDLVPKGTSENDNEIVFTTKEMPQLGKNTLPHWELAQKYDLIDFELGNKITGAGFPVYKGKCAQLQRALISFFLEHNTNAGYTEYQVPLVVNEASGYGTGQLPDKEGQMYHITADNLYLIPTSEVPLTNLFRGELLDEKDLPKKCTAYTPNFRREAGSYGADVRGLNRLHQFDKVEIVNIVKPEDSYNVLDEMITHVKQLLTMLELPYRILRLCGGDLGFTSAITYDFEVYSAAQKRWLEVSSVSNFETFQANRLKLRYKKADGSKSLVHTLNGSSLALPRIMAALLENNQCPEGIKIPEVLIPYTKFDMI